MKPLVTTSRILVGLLFIISGLIKLNDPIGFSFKLEEYFSQAVLNLPFLEPVSLGLALFLVTIEIVLGVMLLVGLKPKITVFSLLGMILFFTFLTFYSAYTGKVTDCGCFGDAIKLTPWESFIKDVILLILIVIMVIGRKYIQPYSTLKFRLYLTGMAFVACLLIANRVLNHLPMKDFRPYKVGNNILAGMLVPEDAPKPIYEYAWKFKVGDAEQVVVTAGDFPTVEGGEWTGDVETTQVQEGYTPPIHDFSIEKEGTDYAAYFLGEEKVIFVIAYDLMKTDADVFEDLSELTGHAFLKDYKVVGLSASSKEVAAEMKKMYKLAFDFYFTDETTLKTMIRANPGVMVLDRGTITHKVHHNDLDDLKENLNLQ